MKHLILLFSALVLSVASFAIGPITGSTSTCVGSTTGLSDATGGGLWSSSNTVVATISTSGLVYGITTGTTIITYTVSSSSVTASVTVTTCSTAPITGTTTTCIGSTTSLHDATTGGTWSSSNTTVATISGSGTVYGVTSGSTIITYTAAGSSVTATITVASSCPVAPIVGYTTTVCIGSSITLSDATTGGVWSAGNSAIATITTGGSNTCYVYGVTAGGVNITYTVSGSSVTASVTVTTCGTAPITGTTTTCIGSTTSLHDATTGGTWSSSNTAVATISGSGIVHGVTAGSTTITYTASGSSVTAIVTVTSCTIGPITGPNTACFWSTTQLRDATTGGVWSTSTTNIATVSYSTGIVYGITPGTAVITYTASGSSATTTITISNCCNSCTVSPIEFYYDLNNDCVQENTEPFNSLPLRLQVDSMGVPIDTLSVTSGLHYAAYGPPGTIYSFSILSGTTSISCPVSGILYDTVESSVSSYATKYIGLSCPGSSTFDLAVNAVIPVTGMHDQWGNIYVWNNTCLPTNAIVTLHYSPKYNVVESGGGLDVRPTPTSYTNSSITWNVTGLSSELSRPVDLYYAIWTDAVGHYATAGDTTNSYVTVTPMIGDIDTSNNAFIKEDTVRASCDPNSIIVSPGSCFPVDTQFQYTIHFENTGTDTAFNIYVMDTLSDNLDAKSLRIVLASAAMDIQTYNNGAHNIVKFDFPNINLLDSSHHGLCDGAVVFTIKNKAGIANNTTIANEAGIYFDYNDVVMTNIVENTKGCPITAVPILNAHKLEIYPNPTTDELTIKMDNGTYSSFTITNNVGQVLIQQQLNNPLTKVNVKTLPAGLYYITVKGDNGNTVQKFVKM